MQERPQGLFCFAESDFVINGDKAVSVHNVNTSDSGRDGQVYDVIGIGFGPANIALAIALKN